MKLIICIALLAILVGRQSETDAERETGLLGKRLLRQRLRILNRRPNHQSSRVNLSSHAFWWYLNARRKHPPTRPAQRIWASESIWRGRPIGYFAFKRNDKGFILHPGCDKFIEQMGEVGMKVFKFMKTKLCDNPDSKCDTSYEKVWRWLQNGIYLPLYWRIIGHFGDPKNPPKTEEMEWDTTTELIWHTSWTACAVIKENTDFCQSTTETEQNYQKCVTDQIHVTLYNSKGGLAFREKVMNTKGCQGVSEFVKQDASKMVDENAMEKCKKKP